MKVFKQFVSGCLLLTLAQGVLAAPEGKQASLDKIKATIGASLAAGKPGISVGSVEKTVMKGVYKVNIEGGPHVYASADGKHFLTGDIYEVSPGRIVNLTEQSKNGDRAKAMASVDKKDAIIFAPKGEVKQVMYVFTDVDCGYCQKLHAKVPEYNELGVEVRYLAYPRAGINSGSYKKVASAWCADDRQAALTKLKQREVIPENLCKDNPVAKQFALGQTIGLSGTPALVLESGELIAGYVEPAQLKEMLKL